MTYNNSPWDNKLYDNLNPSENLGACKYYLVPILMSSMVASHMLTYAIGLYIYQFILIWICAEWDRAVNIPNGHGQQGSHTGWSYH